MKNYATRLLYAMIFKGNEFDILKNNGLVSCYIDDYGAKKKYKNCIFFLFKMKPTDHIKAKGKTLEAFKFLESMTSVFTMVDYYEVDEEQCMFVFKCPKVFKEDLLKFKEGKLGRLHVDFHRMAYPELLEDQEMNWKQEIYRMEAAR